GAEREQRDPADGELAREADHEIEPRDQHPIDAGTRRDHAPIATREQRQRDAEDQQNQEGQRGADRTRRKDRRGRPGLRGRHIRHTRRPRDAPARPSGRASRTRMKTVNTATEAKMPPTRKFAACWNSPRISPATTAPRLFPIPPSATGTKP